VSPTRQTLELHMKDIDGFGRNREEDCRGVNHEGVGETGSGGCEFVEGLQLFQRCTLEALRIGTRYARAGLMHSSLAIRKLLLRILVEQPNPQRSTSSRLQGISRRRKPTSQGFINLSVALNDSDSLPNFIRGRSVTFPFNLCLLSMGLLRRE